MMTYTGNATLGQSVCAAPFLGGPQLTDVCTANSSALFLLMVNSLFDLNSKIGDPCGRVKPDEKPHLSYDFIVVGGGAAGPVVASRLSEIPEWKVLLIEAGPDEPAGTQVPSNLQLFLNTDIDWKYRTTNESYACLNQNGSCSWPRGKNLGGCTSHHGMAYHRGHAKDYERWVAMGCDGWSWDEVFPYFLKSEDNREIGRVSAKYHATGGPMTVERFPWQPPLAWDILEAAREKNFGVTEDVVGDVITGFTVIQTISRNGVRLSNSASFLRPNRNRPNLHVLLNATVSKIMTKNLRAIGVEYILNGKTYSVSAKREVIVSGGSINSAQLLLLSGIGPAEHLKSVGIPVVRDLPGVGSNLHNHLSYGLDFQLNEPKKSELSMASIDLYLRNQTGPLSATGLAQVTAILASSYTDKQDPDLQIFFAGYQAICDSKIPIEDLENPSDKMAFRMTSTNLHPRSRGRVSLKSKNPLEPPIIWSNDLSNYVDVSVIIEGLRDILSLANSTALQKHGTKLVVKPIRECSAYTFGSDDYWRCAIHWDTRPENHQAGTCKMGSSSDETAVVSPKLKVYGIDGLMVADASVMPRVVSGNPVATITMIGERAAAFVKTQYSKS